MRWCDRVYGEVSINDPGILRIIECPTFERLKGIRQAGPSAFAYPFKTVTRHEHSLGVYLLLRRLGAELREQVAGLLHDVSHTAFSHAVDFVFASEEQDHHERLKPVFLHRPDLDRAIRGLGFEPEMFHDDAIYPLLERPLPMLCADRLDYFLRDGIACGVVDRSAVQRILKATTVVDRTIALDDPAVAREAASLFAVMNRDLWASPTESYIYNEFADALREGFRVGALTRDDMLGDDNFVLGLLHAAKSPKINQTLDRISRFQPEVLDLFVPKVLPKNRWLDPPVVIKGQLVPLSHLS
jgi:HD superfamily phosphohydrolase